MDAGSDALDAGSDALSAASDALKARGGDSGSSGFPVDVGLLAYFALWYLGNYYVSGQQSMNRSLVAWK